MVSMRTSVFFFSLSLFIVGVFKKIVPAWSPELKPAKVYVSYSLCYMPWSPCDFWLFPSFSLSPVDSALLWSPCCVTPPCDLLRAQKALVNSKSFWKYHKTHGKIKKKNNNKKRTIFKLPQTTDVWMWHMT